MKNFVNFFFKALNKVFFFNTITKSGIKFDIKDDPLKKGKFKRLERYFDPLKKLITIVVNPKEEKESSGWEYYIATRAHEMLHAFMCMCDYKWSKCIRHGRTALYNHSSHNAP